MPSGSGGQTLALTLARDCRESASELEAEAQRLSTRLQTQYGLTVSPNALLVGLQEALREAPTPADCTEFLVSIAALLVTSSR